ncbi:hypothetical protein D3C78_806680 [compost metagenome]
MRRGQRVQVARFSRNAAHFVAAQNAVVVVVMRARDQLWRAGAPARKLEKRHFIGRRRAGDKVVRRTRNGRLQRVFTVIAAQQHHAHGAVFIDKRIQEVIVRKQRMLAIGNHQRWRNLKCVRVQLAALMAKERIHRGNARLQQSKESDVKLGHVAQLHQRRFAALDPLRLQCGRKIIRCLVELTVGVVPLTVDHRRRVVVSMTRQNVGQRQILPVAFFTVAPGKFFRPTGKGKRHDCSSVQTKNVEHGGEFDAGFAPFADGR